MSVHLVWCSQEMQLSFSVTRRHSVDCRQGLNDDALGLNDLELSV